MFVVCKQHQGVLEGVFEVGPLQRESFQEFDLVVLELRILIEVDAKQDALEERPVYHLVEIPEHLGGGILDVLHVLGSLPFRKDPGLRTQIREYGLCRLYKGRSHGRVLSL